MKSAHPIRRNIVVTGADIARFIVAGFLIGLTVGTALVPHIK